MNKKKKNEALEMGRDREKRERVLNGLTQLESMMQSRNEVWDFTRTQKNCLFQVTYW